MLNIMKADLFRIFKGKGIYIVVAVLIAFTLLTAYSISPVHMGLGLGSDNSEQYGMSEEDYQNFPNTGISGTRDYILEHGAYPADLNTIAHNINLYYVFIALVSFILCCDFSTRTIKNTVSTNISKRKYYFSKLALALLLGMGLVFFTGYLTYVTQLLFNGPKFVSSIFDVTLVIVRQLPLLCAIISVLVAISVIFRKSSLFNGIAIPLVMGFQLLLMAGIRMFGLPDWLIHYELETALSKLCFDPTMGYVLECTMVGLVVFVGSTLLGYTYFQKKDI